MALSEVPGRHALPTRCGLVGAAGGVLLAAAACTGPAQPRVTATPVRLVFASRGQPPAGATPSQVTTLVRRAWTATAAERTAVITVHTATAFIGSDQTASAVADTGTGPAVLSTAAADLRYRATPTATWRWRFMGDCVYGAAPDPGDSARAVVWTRADLAHPAAGSEDLPVNPVDLLRSLSGSLTSVTATTGGILDGTPVTRYDGNAELTAAADAAPAGGARVAVRHLQVVTGRDHLFVQEWIDGAGRIRRLTYTAQSTAPSTPVESSAGTSPPPTVTYRSTSTTTITLGHFGVAAPVIAPAG